MKREKSDVAPGLLDEPNQATELQFYGPNLRLLEFELTSIEYPWPMLPSLQCIFSFFFCY